MSLKRNYFLYLTGILLLSGTGLLLSFKKGDLELYVNKTLTYPFLDVFFKYFTHLGDGVFLVVFFVIFLFVKYRYALILATISVLQLSSVQLIKRVLLPGMARPRVYLEKYDLHFVDGVDVFYAHSFPSGHTATAFSICLLMSMIFYKQKSLQVFLFLMAFLILFSRIYLLQHFFEDVFYGAILGVFITLLSVSVTYRTFRKPIFEKKLSLRPITLK